MASSAAAAFANLSLEELEAVVAAKIQQGQDELKVKLAILEREKAAGAHTKMQQLQTASASAGAAMSKAEEEMDKAVAKKGITAVPLAPLPPPVPHPDVIRKVAADRAASLASASRLSSQ